MGCEFAVRSLPAHYQLNPSSNRSKEAGAVVVKSLRKVLSRRPRRRFWRHSTNSRLRKAGAFICCEAIWLAGWDYRLLNLATKNRPKAAEHMEGSWQPPTGMWKNSRKLCFPRRAIRVVSRQFPCPGGSLETSKSNWRTGFLARLLFMCSRKIWRSGTRSSPMGLTTNIDPEACILPITWT